MEGGMLMHAVRLSLGKGVYLPPTAEFPPYFYTPGYPYLLSLLASAEDISYALLEVCQCLRVVARWRFFSGAFGASPIGTMVLLGLACTRRFSNKWCLLRYC